MSKQQEWGKRPVRLCRYDFAVDGGAQGTITPATNFTVPEDALVSNVRVKEITALAGGAGSTIALQMSGGDALLSATVLASVPGTPGTGIADVQSSGGETTKVVIATADVTAGVFDVYADIEFPLQA